MVGTAPTIENSTGGRGRQWLRGMTSLVAASGMGTLLLLPAQAKVLDRTLATINGQAILLSEFEKNATPILDQFKKMAPASEQTPEHVADIKKRVLDQMIEDRLLTQEAKKKSIRISQLEIDDGVKKVRGRFATEEEFKQEMQKAGMNNEEFRGHLQDQLSTIKLIDQEVKAKVPPPSDTDVKDLYDTLQAILQDKPIPGSHTPSEIDELKSLAQSVQRRFGERVRARHILIRTSAGSSKSQRDEAQKTIKDIQSQLKKGADFSELSKKYSEDPQSKERGGDLGYFSRNEMVPPFEKAAFGLAVGQTSDIVETDFGYHLILVDEKKASRKPNFDELKDDLREYLFQQRAAKRLESYVKELRSKAEIKVNNFE
jgi:peptidyl-prolyl cis-trans isomerase C